MQGKKEKKKGNRGNWGGNRKSEYDFKLDAPTVRIPRPYHKVCQEYAKLLEEQDIRDGKIVLINEKWVYLEQPLNE